MIRPPRICVDCGEHEFDDRRSTGAGLELERCADGLYRCPACASYYAEEHRCFICERIQAEAAMMDGVVVCAECRVSIERGSQARPSEIMEDEDGEYSRVNSAQPMCEHLRCGNCTREIEESSS